MKIAYSSIIGAGLISNVLSRKPPNRPFEFKKFHTCPTEASRNNCNQRAVPLPSGMQSECLMTGASEGGGIVCDPIDYFGKPNIGDPCPSEENRNSGWRVNTCPGTGPCFVVKFGPTTRRAVAADPRKRQLNIMCGTTISNFDKCPNDDMLPLAYLDDPKRFLALTSIGRTGCDNRAVPLPSGMRSECLITGASEDGGIVCDSIDYFGKPNVGDPCPSEENRNSGWSVNTCPGTGSCTVAKFGITMAVHYADPRKRLLNIQCRTDETPTPSSTHAPTPAPSAAPPSTYAPTPDPSAVPPSCDAGDYAYDNKRYCKCPGPVPVGDQFEVSVCGDATYLLPKNVQPCSGPVDQDPAGTGCPKQHDVAVNHCREEVLSYLTGSGKCNAPEDATCEKLGSGVWGCVFPGNCNTVNTCLNTPACEGDYVRKDDGTCVLGDNGYPVPASNCSSTVNTTTLPLLVEDVQYSAHAGAAGIAVASITLFATITGAYMFV